MGIGVYLALRCRDKTNYFKKLELHKTMSLLFAIPKQRHAEVFWLLPGSMEISVLFSVLLQTVNPSESSLWLLFPVPSVTGASLQHIFM